MDLGGSTSSFELRARVPEDRGDLRQLLTSSLVADKSRLIQNIDSWIHARFGKTKGSFATPARNRIAQQRGQVRVRNYAQNYTGSGPRASTFKAQDLFLKNRSVLVDAIITGKPLLTPGE